MQAIIYFYLGGGCDSYNLLTPHTCSGEPGDTVYDRYRKIRGKRDGVEGVGMPKTRVHDILANNIEQPCTHFGIHENLPVLKELYDKGEVNFIANGEIIIFESILLLYLISLFLTILCHAPFQLVFSLNLLIHRTTVVKLLSNFLLIMP